MADYFEEMGWAPLRPGEEPDHLLHMARLLRDMGMLSEFADGQSLPPPAAKTVLENLPDYKAKSSDQQCSVCLANLKPEESLKELPCSHIFHSSCIVPWLQKTNSCPLCRYEFQTDDEEYEAIRQERIRAAKREAEIELLHNSMFS